MGRKIARYADEFRLRMIELVRAGRSPESLAKEFEPSAQTIRNWVAQDDRDAGRRSDGLTSAEREELADDPALCSAQPLHRSICPSAACPTMVLAVAAC
jgi:transposase